MTKSKTSIIFCIVAILLVIVIYYTNKSRNLDEQVDSGYAIELASFRRQAYEDLTRPKGWLSIIGLSWLKPGANTIGSAPNNDIVLPLTAAASIGTIYLLDNQTAQIRFVSNQNITLNNSPVQLKKNYVLTDDTQENPSTVKNGSIDFFIIARKNGLGVRIRDTQSRAHKNFEGRKWYPPKKDFIIDAEWVEYPKPRILKVPDILGNKNENLSPGFARFTLSGNQFELHPIFEDNKLFYVFRDLTSGKETYGAARFLYSDKPKNGHVLLDFNKATNPPCAFIHYATCPIPPRENVLNVAINAGELKSVKH